jgi:AraC-like DNA-binding protein
MREHLSKTGARGLGDADVVTPDLLQEGVDADAGGRSLTAPVWDIARPSRPSRVAGVSMAGFRDRSTAPVNLRAVPHPAVTLVVEFGDGPLVVDDGTGREQHGSVVAGLLRRRVTVRGENIECLQVRLSPVVAQAVLGAPPGELSGAAVRLDDLWGRSASLIREQLSSTPSWQDRFALADSLLAHRCEVGPPVDPEVAWVWDRIVSSSGRARIGALAAEIGWSRKRLWSRFRSQVGLTPKRAARLVRFDHAAHRLVAGDDAARVAADGGYVDQSHLHREVASFTGMTPAALCGEPWLAVDDIAWSL